MRKMRDYSINLPSWAYHLGYRLEGLGGTYDSLELWKGFDLVRVFEFDKIPNIYEIEDIIKELEDEISSYRWSGVYR